MSSLVKKTIKGYHYYYIVTSARVNGKPRIVSQRYLGTLDRISAGIDALERGESPQADESLIMRFGAEVALLDLAERIKVREIIDKHAEKRQQGLSCGTSMLLAAINRAVCPTSKKRFFAKWFGKTVLPKFFPEANSKNLSSQGFWNNMTLLDKDKIQAIEDDLTKTIVDSYDISTDCLLFDNTNFITYIDTDTPSALAQRGKSKEHRSDLRIVGLSLMVSPTHNIPLFHELYPGNTNDAKRFSEIIGSLKSRFQKLGGSGEITLVFDRGNNSQNNIEQLVKDEPLSFHFVGGLKRNQCEELFEIPKSLYTPLKDERFGETTVYRTTMEQYGMTVTTVITNNPKLFELQLRGVQNNISKCCKELDELRSKLKEREDGQPRRGRGYTAESVLAKVRSILSAEHMKSVFTYKVTSISDKCIELDYRLDNEKFDELKEKILGKSVLVTDHHDWTNEKIVGSYRAQYHVEECFKQLKDTEFLSFRPIRHFTDNNIRVHGFYCVLAFTLSNLLALEFEKLGNNKLTIDNILEMLTEIKQVINIRNVKGKLQHTYNLSRLEGVAKEYCTKYGLLKYAYT